jgi:hypothetical protein
MLQLATAQRTPREADLPFSDDHLVPGTVEMAIPLGVPPDVLARSIHQLELEGVGWSGAADPHRECVVGREIERQRASRDGVAAAREREVESQRLPPPAGRAVQRHANAIGRVGAPPGQLLEVVEAAHGLRVAGSGELQREDREQRDRHPFTLPAMIPWM